MPMLSTKKHVFPIFPACYSYFLHKVQKENSNILLVLNDEKSINIISEQLSFFCPNREIIVFPSWDCAPYDLISPNSANLVARVKCLINLVDAKKNNLIILTNVVNLIQKLPPQDFLKNISRKIYSSEEIKRDHLLKILLELGYRRVDVACDPGNFAVRGDIIDIVSNSDYGWRLSFFGSKIEKIKLYDLNTQISSSVVNEINLLPISEIVLNATTTKNFSNSFAEFFPNSYQDSPLYEAISSGRTYHGMEHYLPCFYPELNNIFDYIANVEIIFEENYLSELNKIYETFQQKYQARIAASGNRYRDEIVYDPLKPEELILSKDELTKLIESYPVTQIHQFNIDDEQATNFKINRGIDFYQQAKLKKISAFDLLKKYRDDNKVKIIIGCNSAASLERIRGILDNYNIHTYKLDIFADYKKITGKTIAVAVLALEHGFSCDEFTIISEQDLLGERIIRKKSNQTLEKLLNEINLLQEGEYVVHQKHGIGIFSGLETLSAVGIAHDFIKIIYDAGDILYIPVENLEMLTRYGSSEETVKLDKLGGISWTTRKAKLKEKLKEIAAELIRTAALRLSKYAEDLIPLDEIYAEFCQKFLFVETEDQMNAITDVLQDLSSGKPMDRLICGDVGFGKTEIAMRAAFVATNPDNNKKTQVGIIVPTTLLARQHFHNFTKRFAGFNVKIAQLSRLISDKDAKLTKQGIKAGEIDIVIATHALLAKNVEFKNLGLLIVDEEQHFGVLQKEKIKKLQANIDKNIHVLTLSATPIPRTLQMSLTGVRDLSIIATPPIDRQVVKTFIMNYDSVVLREAIIREFYRGGQIFFVCPRISDITEVLPKLTELVPEVKIKIAHGQMSPNSLEEIMNDFCNKKFDLLLSTSIIESGIDIAEANTIIIYRADRFGLSALYQLRGRVGRSNVKAYAYLLTPNKKLTKLATSRLEVMQSLDTLGAGFIVASHDMDIRGFGNLVGDEQSGHIREVGLELYQQMLKDAILNLKSPSEREENEEYSPQINIGLPVLLPESYIADISLRLNLYRKLAGFKSASEVDEFADEMLDRFGNYPEEVEYLLAVIKLKIKAKQINIDKIDAGPKAITISYYQHKCLHPEKLLELIKTNQLLYKLRSDQKVLVQKEFKTAQERIKFIDRLLDKLSFLN